MTHAIKFFEALISCEVEHHPLDVPPIMYLKGVKLLLLGNVITTVHHRH